MLLSRLVGFYKAQLESPKISVRFLIRLAKCDQRTILGNTLEHIRAKCGVRQEELSKLTPKMGRKHIRYMSIPDIEKWRVPLMNNELLQAIDAGGVVGVPGFTLVDDILTSD